MNYAQTLNAERVWRAEGSLLQRYVFPAYLAFSVCFYSMRFLFGWGDALTTYESDMPTYLAAMKDVVWLGLVVTAVLSSPFHRAVVQVRKHPVFFSMLGLFCAWMATCSIVHLFFFNEPLEESLLYNIRKPLEYIPAAFLVSALIGDWAQIAKVWLRLNWIALGFAIFELVTVIGGWKQTGFGWGGFNIRFGGILGAPNDWGIYSGCAMLAIWALAGNRLQFAAFAAALMLSQSRSAILGFLVGATPLLFRRDVQRRVLRWSIALAVTGTALTYYASPLLPTDIAWSRVELDESALNRLGEVDHFKSEFRDLDDITALIFGVRRFHVENFYLATLVRGGIPAAVFFSTAIGMSIIRGWQLRMQSMLHLAALCTVVVISFASLFVPYPDIYPTNFYLWLACGILWTEVPQTGTAGNVHPDSLPYRPVTVPAT